MKLFSFLTDENFDAMLLKAINNVTKNVEILENRKVKSSSPGMWNVGIDAKITEKE